MKTLQLTTALGVLLFAASSMQAQVSVNVNIGTPPVWGPAVSANVDYYFLPDIDVYYDIRQTQYVYLNQGRWIRSRNLPVVYKNYDLRRGRTVVINDYHGRTPYIYHDKHMSKYHKDYGKRKNYYAYNDHHDHHDHHDNHRDYDKKGKGHDKHKH
ncbi:hypothetical protein [Flavobacterium agrisoli]|uniref:Uncharacterized protein n=1 Tax=Flavobacterium agrisoli TaxID=2793066 RepID=A0A934PIY6_9FLAO|nr:hypothetical protein [Flavobacterium agrisoli]MBK0368981.1 hypothetical protein [Flavobacterium agrisoli]